MPEILYLRSVILFRVALRECVCVFALARPRMCVYVWGYMAVGLCMSAEMHSFMRVAVIAGVYEGDFVIV